MSGELEKVNEDRIIPTMRNTTPPSAVFFCCAWFIWKNTLGKEVKTSGGVVLERLYKHSWESVGRVCHLDCDESWHATAANGFTVGHCKYTDVLCYYLFSGTIFNECFRICT